MVWTNLDQTVVCVLKVLHWVPNPWPPSVLTESSFHCYPHRGIRRRNIFLVPLEFVYFIITTERGHHSSFFAWWSYCRADSFFFFCHADSVLSTLRVLYLLSWHTCKAGIIIPRWHHKLKFWEAEWLALGWSWWPSFQQLGAGLGFPARD